MVTNKQDLRVRYFDIISFIVNDGEMSNWFSQRDKELIWENIDTILDIVVGSPDSDTTVNAGEALYCLIPGDFRYASHILTYLILSIVKTMDARQAVQADIADPGRNEKEKFNKFIEYWKILLPVEELVLDFIVETQFYRHDEVQWNQDEVFSRAALAYMQANYENIVQNALRDVAKTPIMLMYATYCEHVNNGVMPIVTEDDLKVFTPALKAINIALPSEFALEKTPGSDPNEDYGWEEYPWM